MKRLTILFLPLFFFCQSLFSQATLADSIGLVSTYNVKYYAYWFDNEDSVRNRINISDSVHQIDVSSLSEGVHFLHVSMMDSLSHVYITKSTTFYYKPYHDTLTQMEVNYWIDDNVDFLYTVPYSQQFTIDADSLSEGIHTLHCVAVNRTTGKSSVPKSTMFFKKNESKIIKASYWFNDSVNSKHDTIFANPQDTLIWIGTLQSDSLPIHSMDFHFENDTAPMMFARNKVTFAFENDKHRVTNSDYFTFIDYHVGKRVVSDTILPNTTDTVPVLAENDVKWYRLTAFKGDTIAFRSNDECSLQLFAPSSDEIYNAQEDSSTFDQDILVPGNGTYWLAVHDKTTSLYDSHLVTYTCRYKYVLQQINKRWSTTKGSYTWRGKAISESGVYRDSIITEETGLDTVYELTINFIDPYLFKDSAVICQGESFDWRGNSYTNAGIYYDSLKTYDDIDSVYQLTLAVNPTYLFTETYTICQGETYQWHNRNLSAAEVYYDSLLANTGCDSVYQLTLTVNPIYTITFANYDGTVLQRDTLCIGTMPQYIGSTPTRPATAQYTYSFKEWSPAVVAVTAAATYTAQYDSVVNKYTVSFVNYDGTTLQSDSLNYGAMPQYTGLTPNKPATAQYTYSFKGWNPVVSSVIGAATYTAQYDSVINQYTVTFVNYDGTTLQSGSLNYGVMPTYSGTTPTKPATVQYTYTFRTWSPALATVTGTATYTAQYDSAINQYNVTFVNYDGTTLQSGNVNYGVVPTYTGSTPTKPATAQYTYSFKAWTPALTSVTGAATYTAQFDSVINQYNVTFVNYDGTTLESGNLNYGATPQYTGSTPTKPATAQYSYTFKGWNPVVSSVIGAATYTAQYDSIINQYTVTFVNYDGTTLQSGSLNYGVTPTYTGTTPTKPATAQYTYTFRTWSPALATVTGTATYTAQYDSVINQYNVTFVNYDGTTLQSGNVNYGVVPTYTGSTPTKPATAQYTYSFKGWSPELTSVTGAATYTAQFDSVINQYTISFINYDGTTLQSSNVNYGTTPTYTGATPTKPATAQYTYTFKNWLPAIVAVTGAATYTAQYDSVLRSYTVSVNYDSSKGSVAGAGTYNYGASITLTATAVNHYHFVDWNNTVTTPTITFMVTGDSTLTANFEIDQHTITAYVNDTTFGSVTGADTYDYGTVVTLTAVPNDHYVFTSWSNGSTTPTITVTLTYDMTITANFRPAQYQVAVMANDNSYGTVTGGGTYDYGTVVTLTATAYNGYEFTNWSNGDTTNVITIVVESDTTFTANFTAVQTAVDDVEENRNIIIAPNPVRVGETICIKGDFTDEEMDGMVVEILSTDGTLASRTAISATTIELDGINVVGTYIVRITTGTGKVYVKKLMVK